MVGSPRAMKEIKEQKIITESIILDQVIREYVSKEVKIGRDMNDVRVKNH